MAHIGVLARSQTRYAPCKHIGYFLGIRSLCVADENEVLKPGVPEIWDDPYHFLFPAFASAVLGIDKHLGDTEPLEIVLDSSERLDKQAKMQAARMLVLPPYADRVVNVWFRDDKDFLALQAADLLAWQVRRAFCVPTEPRRRHFDNAKNCPREKPFDVELDRKDVQNTADVIEAGLRKHAEALGIPRELLTEDLLRRKK